MTVRSIRINHRLIEERACDGKVWVTVNGLPFAGSYVEAIQHCGGLKWSQKKRL